MSGIRLSEDHAEMQIDVIHAFLAASFVELSSPFGHDSFLLEAPEMNRVLDGFLRAGA